jgi:glycosyltransferase involved in cell wall biosynthesis
MVHRYMLDNLRSANRVLTNSHFTREIHLLNAVIDCKVVYYGVDIDAFKPDQQAHPSYVLSVASLDFFRGHQDVIEAIGKIPIEIRPMLVIATLGTDATRIQTLKSQALELGVDLSFTHGQTSQEMQKIYSGARLLISAPILEPLGMIVLEAMACGVPVIGVKEGGLRETILDGITGYLIERDPDIMAEAISTLLLDEPLRQKLGIQARQVIEESWTWKRSVDSLEKQFHQTVIREMSGE